MTTTIENRYEFLLLFDVENGNPNGDPDAGNTPRIDFETGKGIVTDVCLKRKIRNHVALAHEGEAGFNVYIQEKAVLSTQRKPAYEAADSDKAKNTIEYARDWMCKNFYDIRTFGAVMSTKENNCGQVRGPVQLAFAKSVEPIVPQEISITRMAVETEKEAKDQSGDNRTMGRKHIVPYGLYVAQGFVSAPLAAKTGFTEDDLELLWEALINMFEHDRSAARGLMSARKLVVFKHDNKLGNAPAHALFDLVSIKRTSESEGPARTYSDYEVAIGAAPEGVEILEKL